MIISEIINSNTALPLLGVCVFAYLMGSLNFALIICKLLGKEDVRKFGSGNAGMTNMLRTYGKTAAVLTTLGDFFKGLICVAISRALFKYFGITTFDVGYIVGFSALIGHLYPIFFGFKGGKGVLTAFGIVLILNPLVFGILFIIYVPMAFLTRIVSLASVLGVATFPILNFFVLRYYDRTYIFEIFFSVLLCAFILYSHRANIKRLLNGTENRFGASSKKKGETDNG